MCSPIEQVVGPPRLLAKREEGDRAEERDHEPEDRGVSAGVVAEQKRRDAQAEEAQSVPDPVGPVLEPWSFREQGHVEREVEVGGPGVDGRRADGGREVRDELVDAQRGEETDAGREREGSVHGRPVRRQR